MWFWVVTFGITGGVAFIVGLRRFQTVEEAVSNLSDNQEKIDDIVLARDEGDIVEVEIVWKRER